MPLTRKNRARASGLAMMQSSLRHDSPPPCNQWPESFGAASCMRPRDMPPKFGQSRYRCPRAHLAFVNRLTRNQAHAPDPHVGPYLQKCNSFRSAGWASVLEHDLSTEEERCTIPSYPGDGATRKKKVACGVLFSVEGRNWCLPVFRGGDPISRAEHARRPRQGRPISRKSSVWPKSSPRSTSPRNSRRWSGSVPPPSSSTQRARKAEMNAPAQDLLGDDFNLIKGRPAARDPRQQSPTAAAGFGYFAFRNAEA